MELLERAGICLFRIQRKGIPVSGAIPRAAAAGEVPGRADRLHRARLKRFSGAQMDVAAFAKGQIPDFAGARRRVAQCDVEAGKPRFGICGNERGADRLPFRFREHPSVEPAAEAVRHLMADAVRNFARDVRPRREGEGIDFPLLEREVFPLHLRLVGSFRGARECNLHRLRRGGFHPDVCVFVAAGQRREDFFSERFGRAPGRAQRLGAAVFGAEPGVEFRLHAFAAVRRQRHRIEPVERTFVVDFHDGNDRVLRISQPRVGIGMAEQHPGIVFLLRNEVFFDPVEPFGVLREQDRPFPVVFQPVFGKVFPEPVPVRDVEVQIGVDAVFLELGKRGSRVCRADPGRALYARACPSRCPAASRFCRYGECARC